MFGSDSYPVYKLGRQWTYESKAVKRAPLYPTKREAAQGWEIMLAKWRRMYGLEAQARALAVQS